MRSRRGSLAATGPVQRPARIPGVSSRGALLALHTNLAYPIRPIKRTRLPVENNRSHREKSCRALLAMFTLFLASTSKALQLGTICYNMT